MFAAAVTKIDMSQRYSLRIAILVMEEGLDGTVEFYFCASLVWSAASFDYPTTAYKTHARASLKLRGAGTGFFPRNKIFLNHSAFICCSQVQTTSVKSMKC